MQNNNQNRVIPNMNSMGTLTIQESLNYAYNCAQIGNALLKQFSFYDSLYKFNEAYNISCEVFPQIEDTELRMKVQQFINAVSSQIQFVDHQIKKQFE